MKRCDPSFPRLITYCLAATDGDGSAAGQVRNATLIAMDDATDPRMAEILLLPWLTDGFAPLAPGIPADAVRLFNIPEASALTPGHWTAC